MAPLAPVTPTTRRPVDIAYSLRCPASGNLPPMSQPDLSRAEVLRLAVAAASGTALSPVALAQQSTTPPSDKLTVDDLKAFAKVAGLTFTDAEYEAALRSIQPNLASYAKMRQATEANRLVPPNVFRVHGADEVGKATVKVAVAKVTPKKPSKDEDVAFLTVNELGHLLRSRQISSVDLTKLYLRRLKEFGPKLRSVVTLCEDLALKEAAQADAEIGRGRYRGPLHGIPYGIKDLFSARGYPTQWGTAAYQGQVIDEDSAVVEKLRAAGAILVAKLSLGALAMNDNWFGGKTLNPWNPEEGSSGSSAGSAASVAAGLVPFAIGTETSGSIMSPSQRCRVTGLRPTFGSVSRFGGMCLAWSMDKVGPICRTAEDAALVLAALLGRDSRDPSSLDRPFAYRTPKDLKGVKVGVLGNVNEKVLAALKSLGAETSEFKQPPTPAGVDLIIGVEAATMFDALTRSERIALVTENQWPQLFRAARFVPAVEYAQAERSRMLLVEAYEKAFEPFDLVVGNGSAGSMIYTTNLTGHPQIHVPFEPLEKGYTSFSLFAKPFQEARLVGAAHLIQMQSGFYRLRPDLSKF